ncbi:M42 family metallopeptidase [Clostridium sp. 'deep sea']|uniref:M42 family metallopeptidase n=1 Tax=Clostridium sp. 'deep sea' TaxID=2779445 RepID=UPI0018966B6A|nr:M42 family metallopeptidase [Clostridium sp. 'deep sea']QOR36038.1 M42 family metallopeptidase [Clostridium sp. 'deep sea']
MKFEFNPTYTINFMQKLLNTPSASGYTKDAIELVKNEFKTLGIDSYLTNKGGLIATIKGENDEQQRTISGHVDTLGAMVRSIKAGGTLRLTPVGGYMWNAIEGEYCTIITDEGKKYTGTILFHKPSTHVSRAGRTEKREEHTMEVRLDEKVKNADDVKKLGINAGNFVCFDPRCVVTESGFIKSRHLDDKVNVATILGVAKYIVENNIKLPYTLNMFITNYEEVGHGASYGTPQKTVEFLAIDMGCVGEDLNGSEYEVSICAKDSSGPYDYELRKKLQNIAKDNGVDYCVDIFPFYGSDASAALRAGANIKHALIGPGVHASHSMERTHTDGVVNTAKLLFHYLVSK